MNTTTKIIFLLVLVMLFGIYACAHTVKYCGATPR